MTHAQNSARGLFAKRRIEVADGSGNNAAITSDSTGVVLSSGLKISSQANAVITGNSTGLVVVGGVRISNTQYVTANSTGLIVTGTSALPGNVDGGVQFTLVSNSTGVAMAVNTTGTTWKYLNVTSVQPT